MPHAKFQSPGINIDRDFQLSVGGMEGGTQTDRQLVSKGPKM